MNHVPAPARGSRRLLAATLAVGMLIVGGAAAEPLPLPSIQWRPLLTVYAEDFETGDGSYSVGGTTSFAHGAVVAPPLPAAGQGPTMWATNPAGNYGDSECGYLQSAPIDLSAAPVPDVPGEVTLARLSYRHWLDTESRYDGGIVALSADGENFTIATPVNGYDQTLFTTARACLGLTTADRAFSSTAPPADDAWTTEQFDVTAFLGGPLYVRWLFASDGDTNRSGWYVDDVSVQLGVAVNTAVETPTPPAPEVPFTTLTPVYQEDFEAGDGGWAASGTPTWQWGEPASPPEPLPGSLKMWGTHLLGDYLDNECATLTSPPIELPGVGAGGLDTAKFTMKLWRYTERLYDGAVLQVSNDDGTTWNLLTPDAGYDIPLSTSAVATPTRTCLGVATGQPVWTGPSTQPAADAYLSVAADVSEYLGSTVRFRIVFGSEASLVRRGVYVDDVAVLVGTGVRPPDPDDPACGGAPGWTVAGVNPSWCYGQAASGPASTKPVFATNLEGTYNASECSTLTSPPVDTRGVPGLGQLVLQMEHFMDTYSSADGGVVQVSKDDGASWATVTPIGGYNSSLGTDARACIAPGTTSLSGWSGGSVTGPQYAGRQFRLTSFEGHTIRIRFIFGSSSSLHDLGWYIRAVSLTKGAGIVPLLP